MDRLLRAPCSHLCYATYLVKTLALRLVSLAARPMRRVKKKDKKKGTARFHEFRRSRWFDQSEGTEAETEREE